MEESVKSSVKVPPAKIPVIDVLSLFPDALGGVFNSSILRRAQAAGLVDIECADLRNYAEGKFKAVDDAPFGGRQGMLFQAPVLEKALAEQLAKVDGDRSKLKVIYTSPRGVRLEQPVLQTLSNWLLESRGRMTIVTGRYEGVDERFVSRWVDLELSLGDFILSGGEIAAMAIVDGIVRLLPGALSDERSAREDSFSNGLLEYPQYTRPREFKGMGVPAELLSGNHAHMERWKLRQSLLLTFAFRPDLIERHDGSELPAWAKELLQQLKARLDLRA